MTMYYYYINGFREGRRHFLSYGFTEEEIKRMESGEEITKGLNTFWMVRIEE